MASTDTRIIDRQDRLDRLLAEMPSVGSRKRARVALGSGKVTIDGDLVGDDDAGTMYPIGARIDIEWNRPGTARRTVKGRKAMDRVGVVVRYEDAHILVADKPPGLLTDAASRDQQRNRDTLRKRVRSAVGAHVWPVHRIDRDTSGLVLFAKTEEAHENLKAQWGERTPLREYFALVEGRFRGSRGRFNDWMRWDAKQRIQRQCDPEHADAVLAEADYTVVEHFGDVATLLIVRLVSGRRNQIRLHAQLAGHPLVGDRMYRDRDVPGIPFPRQALHAHRLGVTHPATGEPVLWESPLPPDIAAPLRDLAKETGVSRSTSTSKHR